uniref:Uncharacterized protein n=1 Tax=Ditylenchus dipsaci TaxID=166011 RepID=A0A915DE33_9BILA
MTYCKALCLFFIFSLVLVTVFAASLNLQYHSRGLENDKIEFNLHNFSKKNASEEHFLNDDLKERNLEKLKSRHLEDPFGHEGKGYSNESSSHSQNSQETSKQLDEQHAENNSSPSDSKPVPEPDFPVGLLSNG